MDDLRNPAASTSPSSNWKANFFTFWASQAFSLLGSQLVQFALIWWLTQKTGSASVLATASLVGLLPAIFIGPFTGALVDRWNRKVVLIGADALIAMATGVIIYLFWAGIVQVWHIYGLMFIRAVAGGIQYPAALASTSLMVPEKNLTKIAGLNQTLEACLSIAAPPLGALLLGILEMHFVLLIDVVTAAIAISFLIVIHLPQPMRTGLTQTQTNVWLDVKAGFRYLRAWPGMIGLMVICALISVAINPATALIPLLVTHHFKGGAIELGFFNSSIGVGAIAGGVMMSLWGGFSRRIVTILSGIIGLGVAVFFIGAAPANALGLALAGSFLVGFMNQYVDGPLMVIIQARVDPNMQGRVFTLMVAILRVATPLGLAFAGPLSDWIGVGRWIMIGGVIGILLGAGAFFVPIVMHIEDQLPLIRKKVNVLETGAARVNPGD